MATTPVLPVAPPWKRISSVNRGRAHFLQAANAANLSAGVTAILFYTFGAAPVLLGGLASLSLSQRQLSSWFFIAFFTSGVATIMLSLRYRLPLAIGFSIPALVLLTSAGHDYSLPELMGASIAAGAAVVALAATGADSWLMGKIPVPLVLGIFVGSTFHFVTGIFGSMDTNPVVIGVAIAGYLIAAGLNKRWLPPMVGAVGAAVVAVLASGDLTPSLLHWGPPEVSLVTPAFSAGALLTLTLPMIVLIVGSGNVPGVGMLVGAGYRPPVGVTSYAVGLASMVNGLFGAQASSLQTAGTAILAGEDAGPREQRYVATTVAGIGCIVIAMAASVAGTLVGAIPAGLVAALAGLALLRSLLDATYKALSSGMCLGAFVALAIAASPLALFGIGSAFWALVGGYVTSLATEREALFASTRCNGSLATAANR